MKGTKTVRMFSKGKMSFNLDLSLKMGRFSIEKLHIDGTPYYKRQIGFVFDNEGMLYLILIPEAS